jgi:hypothetical protein
VHEGAQGDFVHRRVVLEDGMQPDHRERRGGEALGHALRLRQAVRDAARAQHLEGVQQHDLAAKVFQAERLVAVQPGRGLPRRRVGVRGHRKSPSFT